ncbi:MAG TPA: right-handed parallel beta-helix repeat-containing protein [Methylomirabilota bacterium]|nr:right-handed parallel beta-helix repeat-containing protein [Methylomirabilota bacterium]
MKRIEWLLVFACASNVDAADVTVRSAAEFRRAVAEATPGVRILLGPGNYAGGFHFANLRGETNRPIVIAAADLAKPPVISGGGTGMHFTDPAFVELHHLTFAAWSGNGLNIDDGGSFDTPARGVVLHGLTVTNIGLKGNRDGIKLSGLVDFRIEGCTIEGWGIGGGSGIDMVGCHRGLITSNVFRHTDSTGSTGVQCKGGTSRIDIQRNRFENAGGRGVNIGGSTGLPFFRPALKPGGEHREAQDIRVEGNTFMGSSAPVAFVGVDGAVVRFNTIYRPKRWALRILQENNAPGFISSRNGEFTDNVVVFHSSEWSTGGVNIGANTAPQSFKFARNWWHCLDQPARSKPQLPTPETDGVYGKAVQFRDAIKGDLRVAEGAAVTAGAHALKP